MTASVRFIGSGNAFADGGRTHACIHVTAPGVSLLLDCGGSSLPAIKRVIDPATIDGIAISHLHGDHFGGLLYLVMEQHYAGRKTPLAITPVEAIRARGFRSHGRNLSVCSATVPLIAFVSCRLHLSGKRQPEAVLTVRV